MSSLTTGLGDHRDLRAAEAEAADQVVGDTLGDRNDSVRPRIEMPRQPGQRPPTQAGFIRHRNRQLAADTHGEPRPMAAPAPVVAPI